MFDNGVGVVCEDVGSPAAGSVGGGGQERELHGHLGHGQNSQNLGYTSLQMFA